MILNQQNKSKKSNKLIFYIFEIYNFIYLKIFFKDPNNLNIMDKSLDEVIKEQKGGEGKNQNRK